MKLVLSANSIWILPLLIWPTDWKLQRTKREYIHVILELPNLLCLLLLLAPFNVFARSGTYTGNSVLYCAQS
ncbi:hypothetical protein V1511DRAFT_500010 [Dipodascopsis uninucleata]